MLCIPLSAKFDYRGFTSIVHFRIENRVSLPPRHYEQIKVDDSCSKIIGIQMHYKLDIIARTLHTAHV